MKFKKNVIVSLIQAKTSKIQPQAYGEMMLLICLENSCNRSRCNHGTLLLM